MESPSFAPFEAPVRPDPLAAVFGPETEELLNPLLTAPSADPWIIRHDGIWYSLQAVAHRLELRSACRLADLGRVDPVIIWHAPPRGGCSRNLWAPELHRIEGRWFIYFAADDGRNENHRMWVLEADSPFGPWRNRGKLDTGGWAIDGSVIEEGGNRYFAWSGWPGRRNGQQNLYIARMLDPWTLAGPRILIAEPREPWERVALPLCEGPQWLQRDGRTFLVYSASGSWTPDYCLGMLINRDGDLLNPHAWVKHPTPVFQKTEQVWGVGHCCFAHDPAAGDLLFYHAKTEQSHGWDDRNVRVQPFAWGPEGLPDFGSPIDLSSGLIPNL